MRKQTKSRKLPIVLLVALVIASFSVYYYLSTQQLLPSIQLAGFQECPPIIIEGGCSDVSDCLALMPNDMPGDIRDVGDLQCINSECIFVPDSCIEGMVSG